MHKGCISSYFAEMIYNAFHRVDTTNYFFIIDTRTAPTPALINLSPI